MVDVNVGVLFGHPSTASRLFDLADYALSFVLFPGYAKVSVLYWRRSNDSDSDSGSALTKNVQLSTQSQTKLLLRFLLSWVKFFFDFFSLGRPGSEVVAGVQRCQAFPSNKPLQKNGPRGSKLASRCVWRHEW